MPSVIALDAMGSDRAPKPEIEGAILAARQYGVRVLLVRPGFVTGRMTAGMDPAPLATTPAAVGAAVAAALRADRQTRRTVWVPRSLAGLATAMRLVPRAAWRRVSR